mgnify:FL=1
MPLVNFSNVDFDEIKESIKDYLRANSNFTDYDFEGSNLSAIIDTLAYNTYISSYNANMITNEVFIDSATLRENVVSLARNIGYVPRSRKAAVADISFSVNASNTTAVTVTLKAGIVLTTANQFGGNSYTFAIPEDITVPVTSTGVAFFTNVKVYEGTYVTQTFTASSRNPNQRYILPNAGIDTDLIRVIVKDNEASSVRDKYSKFSSLFGVDSQTMLYFLQEIENERYEIMFGDGVFGKKIEEPNFVEVSYIVSNGSEANGLNNFTYSGRMVGNDGQSITSGVSLVFTNSPSSGGSAIESIESIKKYAPQIYASQNRAVTAADFEALVPRIYAEAESVSAYGGEELVPPAYGKVFISVKPFNGVFLSRAVKENLNRELRKFSCAGIVTEILDLKYLFVETESTVYYDTSRAASPDGVKNIVLDNIVKYANSSQLNKFGARFKYSKFLGVIDNSEAAITSNITTIFIRRDMEPTLNTFGEYEICFGNQFYIKNTNGYNIKSSGFFVSGISDCLYLGDIPNADKETGSIFLFKLTAPTQPVVVKRGIGVIDYIHGEIKLNPINIISTKLTRGVPGAEVPLIQISVCPFSNDVIGLQDLYLQLDTGNSTVTMIPDEISSGTNTSGSSYRVTSSYANGSLVRGTPHIAGTSDGTMNVSAPTTTTSVTTTVGTSGNTTTTVPTAPSTPSTPSTPSAPSGGGGGGGYGGY